MEQGETEWRLRATDQLETSRVCEVMLIQSSPKPPGPRRTRGAQRVKPTLALSYMLRTPSRLDHLFGFKPCSLRVSNFLGLIIWTIHVHFGIRPGKSGLGLMGRKMLSNWLCLWQALRWEAVPGPSSLGTGENRKVVYEKTPVTSVDPCCSLVWRQLGLGRVCSSGCHEYYFPVLERTGALNGRELKWQTPTVLPIKGQ